MSFFPTRNSSTHSTTPSLGNKKEQPGDRRAVTDSLIFMDDDLKNDDKRQQDGDVTNGRKHTMRSVVCVTH
jgi:hypothetical protein